MPVDNKKEKKWNWDFFDGSNKGDSKVEIELTEAELNKLSELLERAIPMIEQVNSLYNQYRAGVEKRPPTERRNNLDHVITSIQYMRKPSQSARFMVRQIVSKYLTYKDRWDRIVQAMELGKDPRYSRGTGKFKKLSYKKPA